VQDPEFLADAARVNADVAAMEGEEIGKLVAAAYKMKPEVLARAKAALTARE
jgi:hypothetical protein